jgi:MGT family glycosyltransferase
MMNSGKTILIGTMGYVLAHVGRTLLIGRELRKLGYRVIFAGQGHYLDLLQQEDFEVIPLGGLNGRYLLSKARRTFVGVNIFTPELFENYVQLELELYEQVQPDAVIYDLLPSMGISAPTAGLPCISITNAYVTDYAVPQFSTMIFPPLVRPILEPVRRWVAARPFRQLAYKYAIPPNTIFRDLLTKGDLVLLPDIPEFSPTRNLPARFQYCGPLIWEPADGSITWLDWLDPQRPAIYFTLGSTGQMGMFRRVLQVLRNLDNQVIVTTGDQVRPEELGPLPDNFLVGSFFPGSVVMKHCQVVICHGGNGTIYQALDAGRPVVAIPTHVDQKANGILLSKQGAGLIVNHRHMDQVIPAVRRIMREPAFKGNAERMKEILKAINGPQLAAQLIDNFLENR